MRCILGLCVVLAISTAPAYAWQEPSVSTPVPNIHAPGVPGVTTPSAIVTQTPGNGQVVTNPGTVMPSANPAVTTTPGSMTVTPQPGVTYGPMANGSYYYYPAGTRGRFFRTMAPGYVYTTNGTVASPTSGQVYYTPVRRRWPFGMFQRRYYQQAAPTYTTTYYTTPGYYPTTGYYVPTGYSAPTGYANAVPTAGTPSNTAPANTAAPVYTPTTYDVPTTTPPPPSAVPNPTQALPLTPNRINPR
jgi:hypothetical protein